MRLGDWEAALPATRLLSSGSLFVCADSRRCLSLHTAAPPWTAWLQVAPDAPADRFYHYDFEPLLHSLWRRGGLHPLHGGAVVRDGRAALLLGPSGSGKSTTCLALSRADFQVLADDEMLLEGLTVHGLDSSLFLLESPPGVPVAGERWKGSVRKAEVPFEGPGSAPVGAVLFPRVTGETGLRRLPPTEALSRLLAMRPKEADGLLADRVALAAWFAAVGSLAREVPAFSLDLGPAGVVEAVAEALA